MLVGCGFGFLGTLAQSAATFAVLARLLRDLHQATTLQQHAVLTHRAKERFLSNLTLSSWIAPGCSINVCLGSPNCSCITFKEIKLVPPFIFMHLLVNGSLVPCIIKSCFPNGVRVPDARAVDQPYITRNGHIESQFKKKSKNKTTKTN